MSPIATASDPGRRRVRALAPRWLILTHRYVGIAIGLLMLMWCLSGIVMLFVHYPSVDEGRRVAALGRIDWSRCCRFGESVPADAAIASAEIEDLNGAPVLRLRLADGDARQIDLTTGRALAEVSAPAAAAIAARFARAPAQAARSAVRDQWTVSGEFNDARPFWRVRMADGHGTDVYVSKVSGKIVQHTTTASRIGNWLGPIPHWLYPSILRQYPKVWSQVVIWTSTIGVFLTLTGLYLGIVAWRPAGSRQLSPYRGLTRWHHVTGMIAGLLTLMWVTSGLLSMNPWGLLEGEVDPRAEAMLGPPVRFDQVEQAFTALRGTPLATGQARLVAIGGRAFVLSGGVRFDASGRPTPLSVDVLRRLGSRLGPVREQGLLSTEDAYYFSHHNTVALPVWRVIRSDGARFYLDVKSGELVTAVDAAAREYRWLHLGLHRLDFVPGWRSGATWAAVMVLLLLLTTASVGTGVWMGWRRLRGGAVAKSA